ncbi:SDR family oxidoreductase [Nocardia alni]|uniref:SDR family oxidoreductase n=1 Tax=Nocardia alni TaxID=2815723 RepID=UPI001C24FF5A|nr:SDR family oxidoreductase [Nocardia alni]
MSVILITGASSGIGNLTARALAAAGHTVYAGIRESAGRNQGKARELLDLAGRDRVDLRVVDLDVQSQESADQAAKAVVAEVGRIDAVVHNAGHLALGYTEAFTVEEIAHLFDVNAFSVQRVNRAVLPSMRERRSGTLLYVGSTTTVSVPPFLGPYVASKFAFDALAQVTAYEVAHLGIETVIVMPGAFTRGTDHFPNAGRAADQQVAAAYAELDPLVAGYDAATAGLYAPGSDPDPATVADEIVRIVGLPVGDKPFRSVVDFTRSNVAEVNEVARASAADFVTRMGMAQLLQVRLDPSVS